MDLSVYVMARIAREVERAEKMARSETRVLARLISLRARALPHGEGHNEYPQAADRCQ
jgi:hypothetical protein